MLNLATAPYRSLMCSIANIASYNPNRDRVIGGPPGCSSIAQQSLAQLVHGFCSSGGRGRGGAAGCAYEFLIGDDLKGLMSPNAGTFLLSLVDLASNAALLVPIAGEYARASVKAMTLRRLFRDGVGESADQVVDDLISRPAQEGEAAVTDSLPPGSCLTRPVRCFPAGTLVATPKGKVAIERLRAGDLVLAEEPRSGKVEAERVTAALTLPRSPLLALELSDGSSIRVQPNHVFWLEGGPRRARAGWLMAGLLRPGDRLRTAGGRGVGVLRVRWNVGSAVVYTLTVARDHTFFVGTAEVLVHNAGGPLRIDPADCVLLTSDANDLAGTAYQGRYWELPGGGGAIRVGSISGVQWGSLASVTVNGKVETRATGFIGRLDRTTLQYNSRIDVLTPAGFYDLPLYDRARGHLLGDKFGAPMIPENFIPLRTRANNPGMLSNVERDAATALQHGTRNGGEDVIFYRVTPIYNGSNPLIPSAIEVEAIGPGGFYRGVRVDNTAANAGAVTAL